jgi:osmotically inducible lipoprotein OsmB
MNLHGCGRLLGVDERARHRTCRCVKTLASLRGMQCARTELRNARKNIAHTEFRCRDSETSAAPPTIPERWHQACVQNAVPVRLEVLMFAKATYKTMFSILIVGVALAGCGTTPGERGLTGGLIGAGTGAAIGAAAGNAGTGALIGGLGGAAIGALTSPDALNLGPPPWRQASARRECVRWSSYSGRCVRTARVYTRVARANAYNSDWAASCSRRYRSFDPASGTYRGYDGRVHYCT